MNWIKRRLQDPRPLLSVEFFPPKTAETEKRFLETAHVVSRFEPDFVSITYGAGGSTRSRTIEFARKLHRDLGFRVMPHLTCVGHTETDVHHLLEDFAKEGYPAIMALRGDRPQDGATEGPEAPSGFRYASDLVRLIRKQFPQFAVGVGGYPETHPEASSPEADLEALATKCGEGADFVTTQLFFENQTYFDFVDRCRGRGIDLPILPGILPPFSLSQLERFCGMCQAEIPEKLRRTLAEAGGEGPEVAAAGLDWARHQIEDLLERGAPGVHLYLLNRPQTATDLLAAVRKKIPLT